MPTFFDTFDASVLDSDDWYIQEGQWLIDTTYQRLRQYLDSYVYYPAGIFRWARCVKLLNGDVEIVFDTTVTTVINDSIYKLFVRLRPYTKHLDEGANTFDFGTTGTRGEWRLNSNAWADWTNNQTFYQDETSAAWKIIVSAATGDLTWYFNINGTGWVLKGTSLGYFPPNTEFEVVWMLDRCYYGKLNYDLNLYFDSISITANSFSDPPEYIEASFEPLTGAGSGGPEFIDVSFEPFECVALSGDPNKSFTDYFFTPEFLPEWSRVGSYKTKSVAPEPTLSFGFLDFLGSMTPETYGQFYLQKQSSGNFILEVAAQINTGDQVNLYEGVAVTINGALYWCNLSQVNPTYLAIRLCATWNTGSNIWGEVYSVEWDGTSPRDFTIRFELVGNQLQLFIGIDGLTPTLKTTQTVTTASEYITEFCFGHRVGNAGLLNYSCQYFSLVATGNGYLTWPLWATMLASAVEPEINALARVTHPQPIDIKIFFQLTGLVGGTSDDLDGIDPLGIEGTFVKLKAGSVTIVVDETTDDIGFYICMEEAGAAHNPPDVIVPAANPGNFYWQKTRCDQLRPAKVFHYDNLSNVTPQPFDYDYADADIFWTNYWTTVSGRAGSGSDNPRITVAGIYSYYVNDGIFNFIAVPQRVDDILIPT